MSLKRLVPITLMAVLLVAPAFAERPLTVTIPFDFIAGKTQMSAGDYTVVFNLPNTIRITREDSTSTAIIMTNAVQAKKTPSMGSLVFSRYDELYFLSQIWSPGYDLGRQVPPSAREIEIAKGRATKNQRAVVAASAQ